MSSYVSPFCWYAQQPIRHAAESLVALAKAFGAERFRSVTTMDPLDRPRPKSIIEYVLPRNLGYIAKPVPPERFWETVEFRDLPQICLRYPNLLCAADFSQGPEPDRLLIRDLTEIPEEVRGDMTTWVGDFQIGPHRLFLDPFDRAKVTIATLSVQVSGYGYPADTFQWMRLIKASPSVQAIQTRIEAAIGPVKFGWTWKLAGEKPPDFVA